MKDVAGSGDDDPALVAHLVHEHGRTRRELAGWPLAALHRFEHVEQSMGLLELGHGHPRPAPWRPGPAH